jgi:hypothetical protein
MLNKNLHPSDQDLLLFSDGELADRRAAQIRRHLAACWRCRAQAARIERTIGEFMEAHRQNCEAPPIAGPRALLKARLEESARNQGHDRWQQPFLQLRVGGLAYLCALALIAALGARILLRYTVEKGTEYAGLLPDPSLTPGAIRPIDIGDICSMDHDEVVRSISAALRQRVFDEYGMRGVPFENYEVDYLITPGLGGRTTFATCGRSRATTRRGTHLSRID